MEKEHVTKFLACLIALLRDGQVVVKNKIATVSHTDGANVAMVYCNTSLDIPDGTYGFEFDRLYTALNSSKSKEVNIKFDNSNYTVTYDKTKQNFSLINLGSLSPIRPKLEKELPCVVELDRLEFNDIISVIEKNTTAQKNDLVKITVSYNGAILKFRVEEDSRNFLEREFDLISVTKGAGQQFLSHYPLDYIININGAIKKLNTESISLCFGTDTPLMIKAKDDDVEVEYFVAQRIDPE